jgi:hypothetical protein
MNDFGSTPKTLFFSKNCMTPPRLPLVKAQQSFLSGIRLSREQHGPKVKVTAPPIKKRKFRTPMNDKCHFQGFFLIAVQFL